MSSYPIPIYNSAIYFQSFTSSPLILAFTFLLFTFPPFYFLQLSTQILDSLNWNILLIKVSWSINPCGIRPHSIVSFYMTTNSVHLPKGDLLWDKFSVHQVYGAVAGDWLCINNDWIGRSLDWAFLFLWISFSVWVIYFLF